MAITTDDFNKIWASTSPLTPYEFSESTYKEGWNFIGGTPPSRQMWDFLQKNNDEKMQYLANNYLPLSGGTMTGNARIGFAYQWADIHSEYTNDAGSFTIQGGSADHKGARLRVMGMNASSNSGCFFINADNGTNNKELAGKPDGTLTWGGQPLLPVGIVQAFAGKTIPNGWLLCDGAAVSRTDYAALYAVIGTTYGAGDGSTTFNLPNLVDKFVEGSATAGTQRSAGLPNITGKVSNSRLRREGTSADGAFIREYKSVPDGSSYPYIWGENPNNEGVTIFSFNASNSNSIYGSSTTVQPPALTMRYIIKY